MDRRLVVEGLRIQAGDRTLVQDTSFTWSAGEILALVGPSGAGKSLTARALMGLVDAEPGVTGGDLVFEHAGVQLRPLRDWQGLGPTQRLQRFSALRGSWVSWLPQHTQSALDPYQRVGTQLAAVRQGPVDVVACLRRVGMEHPDRVAGLWPHELSGGMAQRVCVAQLLARNSPMLILDEPTGGLDASAARQLAQLMRALADGGHGLLWISHDLRLVRQFADHVMWMESGRLVESIPSSQSHLATSRVAKRLTQAADRIHRGRV
jgi:ABC-type glutathione transport system ATPase component